MILRVFTQLTVAVLLLCSHIPAMAWDPAQPERLSYSVSWLGIKAGGAEIFYNPGPLTDRGNIAPASSYSIVVRAWTGPAVKWAYHVRDRITVTGEHEPAMPFSTIKYQLEQSENDHRGDKVLHYDRENFEMIFQNLHAREAPRAKPMPHDSVRDLLSVLFQLRTELGHIEQGKTWEYIMYDLTRPHKLTVTALAQATISTPLGEMSSWELSMRQDEIGGAGKVTEGLRIWVSNTPQRYPLKFAIALPLGDFIVRLQDVGKKAGDNKLKRKTRPPEDLPVSGFIPEREVKEAPSHVANPYDW